MRLERADYQRDGVALARYLLGKVLVRQAPEGETAGIIVETEAYCGEEDAACHVYGGRRTPRVQALYGEAGHAYPYIIYGLHILLNVTGGPPGHCALIRALEPLRGIEIMAARRGGQVPVTALTNGPGKLCRAMGIGMDCYGQDLCQGSLYVEAAAPSRPFAVAVGRRIGVDYAGEARDYLWRFGVEGSAFLSRKLEFSAGFSDKDAK